MSDITSGRQGPPLALDFFVNIAYLRADWIPKCRQRAAAHAVGPYIARAVAHIAKFSIVADTWPQTMSEIVVFNSIDTRCYNFLTSSLLPFLFLFCQSTFPISTGGTPLLYLSFPSEQSDTHALLLSSYIAFIYCTASCILA